jgi:glutamate 5-kinase
LYSADPRKDDSATIIPEVHEITSEIEAMAGQAQSQVGTGGMVTKLIAAKVAVGAGCSMVIANGHELNPVRRIEDGATCTWFIPKGTPRTARKHWIAGTLNPVGKLIIDDGALKALQSGKSLLPAGVAGVEGEFQKGDAVIVVNVNAMEVGCGLTAYSAADARLLMGHKSSEIEDLLGYRGSDELIHRDNFVLS